MLWYCNPTCRHHAGRSPCCRLYKCTEECAQFLQPVGMSFLIVGMFRGTTNQPRDLFGVKLFQRLQFAVGVASDAANNVAQLMLNNMATDVFVSQIELIDSDHRRSDQKDRVRRRAAIPAIRTMLSTQAREGTLRQQSARDSTTR